MNEATKDLQRKLARLFTPSCLALAVSGLGIPGVTLAQDAGTGGVQGQGAQLEEVMVTARRRSESLSVVPISITAISATEMLQRSIRTDSDLQSAVPGLTIRQTQGNNSLTYAIRGQSADTFSGSPSAVIAYMDEVPLTISSSSTFYDLESIQVLKGPQGTLFGRNTTGGAVLYTSAKPTNETEGMLRVRGGNYDLREVEGMVNVPLVDETVLLRGAFNTLDRDGYIDNLYNGDELGEIGRDSGRIALTIKPGDRLENTTTAHYSEIDGTNTGASYTYSVYSCGQTNNGFPLNCGSGFTYGPTMDTAFGFEGAWAGYLAEHPEAYAPGLIAYVDEQKRMGYYETRHPGPAGHEGEDWLVTNTTTYEINEDMQIKNIFGASNSKTDSEQPQLGAPFITIATANVVTGKSGNELEVDSLSDELQLTGTAIDGDLTYIVGAYFQTQQADTLWPQTYFVLTPWAPATTATNNFRIETDSAAAYAQGTYSLQSLTGVENLAVTGGFRYTQEDVTIEQLSQADAYGAADQDETFTEPSWEVGLEWGLSDSVFTYLKTRNSFRSGGFNGSAPPVDTDATGGGNKFESETTQDVEAGLKYLGAVFDRPASLNVAVYRAWIDDVQRVEFPDPDGPGGLASIAVTANVPEMEVDGIEIEASFMPADWLELGVAGAYTDAEFTDGEVELFGTLYSYGPVANTPETTGVAWARVVIPTGEELGEISFRAEIYTQDDMYFSNTEDSIAPGTKLDGYELVNARLDWMNIARSNFSAALFGRNLADEDHFVGGMALGSSLGHNAAAVGEPRTWGAEVTYEF